MSADRIRTAAGAAGKEREMERLSRRSFMKIAGAATGAAALAAAPPIARAAVGEEGARKIDPKTAVPDEPVVAYVRNAESGEVTVTSGTAEHTYRDRALVQKLLRAAGRKGVS
jgi:anaerobic selenocysteine-containing dehydrogenase